MVEGLEQELLVVSSFIVTVWIEQQYTIDVEAEDEEEAERKVREMSPFDVTLFGNRTSDYPVHNSHTVDGVKPKDKKS